MKKKILISTGGTGGHVIPATIFYEQLKDKFDVFFVTDKRGCRFLNLEKYKLTVINALTFEQELLNIEIDSLSKPSIHFWSAPDLPPKLPS